MLNDKAVKILEEVCRCITEYPERFEMNHWFTAQVMADYSDAVEGPMHHCGTTACIAGWICAIAYPDGKFTHMVKCEDGAVLGASSFSTKGVGGEGLSVRWLARNALGLDMNEAEGLFHASYWPRGWNVQYRYAESAEVRAAIACNRIRHFINTGE